MNPSSHAVTQYQNTSSKLEARLAIHKYSTDEKGWFKWVADELQPQVIGADVLELGAGTGELWRSIDHSSTRLVLTDFSTAMVEELRKVPKGASPEGSIRVEQVDAARLPFEDASFDVVIANHMLYHLDDPNVALKEFHRVLRAGGRVNVALNGRDHLEEIIKLGESIGRPSTILNQARITAENAEEAISKFFVDVEVKRSPGGFDVPSPGPLLDYLNSWDAGPLDAEKEEKARRIIEKKIEAEGSFKVVKNMVLFSGVKK